MRHIFLAVAGLLSGLLTASTASFAQAPSISNNVLPHSLTTAACTERAASVGRRLSPRSPSVADGSVAMFFNSVPSTGLIECRARDTAVFVVAGGPSAVRSQVRTEMVRLFNNPAAAANPAVLALIRGEAAASIATGSAQVSTASSTASPSLAHYAEDRYFECLGVGSFNVPHYFMINTQRQEFRIKTISNWRDECGEVPCHFSSSGVVTRGSFMGSPFVQELRQDGYYNNNGQIIQCRVLGNRPPVIDGSTSPARG